MRNSSALIVLLAASGSALAGGFAAPIASQITTLVPPPILVATPEPTVTPPAPPAEPTQPVAAVEPPAAAAPAVVDTGVRVVTNPATGLRRLALPREIVFPVSDAALNPEYDAMLSQIAAVLKADPSIKLNVVGHTDSTAAEGYNQALSVDRAKSVTDALEARGVAPDRLVISGAGESQPIADNATDAGRQANRRTELVIQN